ncbi:MAG: hypothetical protein ACLFP4_01165 [Spirochaetales bacterium]
MRSRRCSRTDFRKSLRSVGLVAMLVAAAYPLAAQLSHEEQVFATRDVVSVSIDVSGYNRSEFFTNLYDGMTARIEYRIRFSVPREQPFQVLGPRLLHEVTFHRSVYFDRFSGLFHITRDDDLARQVQTEGELLEDFFVLDSREIELESIPVGDLLESESFLVETRVVYNPILFVPALRILSVFLADDEIVSPRRSVVLSGVGW